MSTDSNSNGRNGFSVRNDTIENYLTDMNENGFGLLHGFVLKHGSKFGKRLHLPEGEEPGAKQICFFNAFVLTQKHPELIYCEGFFRMVFDGYLDPGQNRARRIQNPAPHHGYFFRIENRGNSRLDGIVACV